MEKEIHRQNAEAEANKALRELVKHLKEENGRLVRANTELKDETYFLKMQLGQAHTISVNEIKLLFESVRPVKRKRSAQAK